MKLLHSSFIAFCLVSLTACALFGVQTAQTFDERVVAGYASVAGAADIAGALLDAGQISPADARNAHTQLTTLKEGIDVSVAIKASGDFSTAEARLNATIQALNILRTYLNARGA